MKVKKLNPNAYLPMKATDGSAGYDLFALYPSVIKWNETGIVETGISMAIPDGCVGLIFARSGIATRNGIRPANCVGVIDPDYRGEIKVALHNDGAYDFDVKAGDRIAQILFVPCFTNEKILLVDELDKTDRGNGGFGSTGK